MSSSSRKQAAVPTTVVVKRKRRGSSGGHHGGSWKVAYADFVTAMMAFFLLMWLLGSTNPEQKEAIENYFKRPLSEVVAGGPEKTGNRLIASSDGSLSADSLSPGQIVDIQSFDSLQTYMEMMIRADPALAGLKDQVIIEITTDGMLIQLLDGDDASMFERSSAVAEAHALRLLARTAPLIESMKVKLLVSGHTDATPYSYESLDYGNWELPTDRANAARRALVAGGLADSAIVRVDGYGPSSPLIPEDPHDPRNRRVSLFLFTQQASSELVDGSEPLPGHVVTSPSVTSGGE